MSKLLAVFLVLILTGCGPSCEEKGGKMVQGEYVYIPQTVGRITILQMYPNYTCVIEDKK